MKLQRSPSIFRHPLAAILLLCAAEAIATTTATTYVANSDVAFKQAMEQHKLGNWSHAYGRFSALADGGDAEAARIALFMLRHGSEMYGLKWGASQPQIDQWTKLALQPKPSLEAVSGD
ncbi:hypothetical protein [Rhodoferax sp.]|uniref:hypothetical protein n=1 Tax=Rhodoferax sp. TaxID=50421 RepID=UPI001EBE8D73|nr:hypothetical protein [Rhodoferax sp.]MBT9505706.1 hypothetical protein [Rhodoferax sp.]